MPDDVRALLDNRPASVGRMFFDRVEATPDLESYRYPVGGTWESVTWAQTGEQVARIAAGLIALGVEPEQRVAIASGTSYDWILADLAIMSAGAATTTVYPSTIADDVAYILSDSESRVVFAEDDTQVAKLRDQRAAIPSVVKVVTFAGTPDGDPDDDWVIDLEALEALGSDLLSERPDAVHERVDGAQPDHLSTLMYTSGTTGRPKGVRLSHRAWTYEGVAVQATGLLTLDDLQYLWLPLAHAFGKVLLTTQLAIGFPTAVDGNVDKIVENLAVIRPTFMGAAPRIFEKAHSRVVTMVETEGGARKQIFDQAFKVGRQWSRLQQAGKPIPMTVGLQRTVFDALVYKKIRARFGGRLRFFVSGSAALNRDIAEWFHAAGIVILEGYGLTETSAGTCVNRPGRYKFGTVGLAFDDTEIKIADDGEVLIKGPGVMDGYHKLDQATGESLVDGWLHTGDIGELDSDGYLKITDRKKDLFKTSGGKYIAPQVLEGQFKAVCPYVSQFVVHGNERKFVSAIITLDPDAVDGWAGQNGLSGRSYAEIVMSDQARQMVQGYVDQLNDKLNRWEQIKQFVILDHDLTVEDGEITPSMKVKRRVVEDRYRVELDNLYA
ncbi:MAG TPA: long-chain fatty acid--CoA ligase [Nocardioidaceae bacterium]|nr:long-chain fatty acid--CoA ligase [Nocardioidaceae bacterium]